MTTRLLFPLALIALAVPQLIPLATQQRGAPPQTPVFGTIQGTVMREGTNEPIAGVQVTLGQTVQGAQLLLNEARRGGQSSGIPAEILQSARGTVRGGQTGLTAVSDQAGQFTIKNVPAGIQNVSAELEGYFGAVFGNGNFRPVASTAIIVKADQTSQVHLTLVPGANVGGRVLDPSGKPLSDSAVLLLRPSYRDGIFTVQPANYKTTDDRGEYRFYHLPPGEYYLAVNPRANASAVPGNSGGAALREVFVSTFYPNAIERPDALPLTLRSGDDVTHIDIQTRTATAVRISGRVTSTFPAVVRRGQANQPTASVVLIPRDTKVPVDINGNVSANVREDGGFEIPNVTPGTYDLVVHLPIEARKGWGGSSPPATAVAPWAFGRTTVEVRDRNLDSVAIVVRSGNDLNGRLIIDGKPAAAKIRISVRSDDETANISDRLTADVLAQISQFQAPIGEDGTFTIPLLPEGRYRFQVELAGFEPAPNRGARRGQAEPLATNTLPALPLTAYLADILQGSVSVYDNGIVIGSETVNPVDVVVNTVGGSLEGTILDPGQRPASDALVVLVPPDHRRQNGALYKTARSDAQGHFIMSNLAPGPYTLFAWTSIPPGGYQNAEFMSRYAGRGASVIIETGRRTTAKCELIP